jgi:hypothetical protein
VEFVITGEGGESLTVSAENWVEAFGKALTELQLDPSKLVRWICTSAPGGAVMVEDPVEEKLWRVKPQVQVVKVVAVGPESGFVEPPEEEPEAKSMEIVVDPAVPPPVFTMPVKSSLEKDLPPPRVARSSTEGRGVFSIDDIAEQLFDLSMDIAGAEPAEACQKALDLAVEFVPCEAASVARGSELDFHLTIVAAAGPVAEQVKGRKIEFGQGIVGVSFEARVPMQVENAQEDERHDKALDAELGFVTREVLCVPIVSNEGIFGVFQLINPPRPFEPEDVEIVQTIGRTLAHALAQSME